MSTNVMKEMLEKGLHQRSRSYAFDACFVNQIIKKAREKTVSFLTSFQKRLGLSPIYFPPKLNS